MGSADLICPYVRTPMPTATGGNCFPLPPAVARPLHGSALQAHCCDELLQAVVTSNGELTPNFKYIADLRQQKR